MFHVFNIISHYQCKNVFAPQRTSTQHSTEYFVESHRDRGRLKGLAQMPCTYHVERVCLGHVFRVLTVNGVFRGALGV